MLDYFKVPVATGSISVLIIIGVTVAVGQDMLEILTFFKEKQ
jgi:hypothetical protein